MLCLLTLVTCAHAGSFYFELYYFAGSDSWTSLWRFACFAQLGAHMTRSRGSPPLNFDGGPRGPPIKIWGGRALICALWFALLICVICWPQKLKEDLTSLLGLLSCSRASAPCFVSCWLITIQLVSWLVGWLIDWFVGLLVGWLAGFLTSSACSDRLTV